MSMCHFYNDDIEMAEKSFMKVKRLSEIFIEKNEDVEHFKLLIIHSLIFLFSVFLKNKNLKNSKKISELIEEENIESLNFEYQLRLSLNESLLLYEEGKY